LFHKATKDIRLAFPADYAIIETRSKGYKRFAGKAIDFIVKEKEPTQRQLGRQFSREKKDIELLLSVLDTLSPAFV
jgi:hypothetical protein